MTSDTEGLGARAREMLAEQYEAKGLNRIASEIRRCGTSNGLADDADGAIEKAIRAIEAALSSAGVDGEECKHEGWSFARQGRRCRACGVFVVDFGD